MSIASPFSLCVVAMTALAFLGLPIGHAMIAGSILYLALAGLDMGTAAEQFALWTGALRQGAPAPRPPFCRA